MINISKSIVLAESELDFSQIRSSGPGGQHVNKVATAVHLRFDILNSSLPDFCKQNLLTSPDKRISRDGIIIIKAQQYRSLEKNKEDAISRLIALIRTTLRQPKHRKPTRPTAASRKKRLDTKRHRADRKKQRKKVSRFD